MKWRILALAAVALAAAVHAGEGKAPAQGQPEGGGGNGPRVMKQGLVAHYFKDPKEWDGHWLDRPGALPDAPPADWTFREYRYSRREPLIHHLFIRRGWFSVRWVGYVKIPPAVTDGKKTQPEAGETHEVTFELWMDDGARFWLDGKQLVDDWRPCAEDTPGAHRQATAKLSAGYHRIVVEYFQGQSLQKDDHDPAKLYWAIPSLGIDKLKIVPASHLFHADEDELDFVPSQGLSPEDLARLDAGELAPERPHGGPEGGKPEKPEKPKKGKDAGEY